MPEYPYGGGAEGTGPKPLHMRVTPAELAQACGLIRTRAHTREGALVLSCKTTVTDDSIGRSMRAGRAAAERMESEGIEESDLSEKERSALRFFDAIRRALMSAESLLIRQAHCDPNVVIAQEPDTTGPNGEVVKGKRWYADPKGAPQAWARLQLSSRFRLPKQEDALEVSVKDAPPTREELLSDLRTLIQTDPDLIAEAGLSVR